MNKKSGQKAALLAFVPQCRLFTIESMNQVEMHTADNLQIRPATSEDAPRLVEMINAAFAVETFLEGTRTNPEQLAASLASGTILVAEFEGNISGSVYCERRGAVGYMGMLAVDPLMQGRGVARQLVSAAEAWFRLGNCSTVEISVLNLRAELLPRYQRMGFSIIGREEFHYPRTFVKPVECFCIVMSKPL